MKILILTREREKRGLSKFALGRIANVHPATVGKIESGRQVPYAPQLTRLAEALEWKGEPQELLEVADDGVA